MTKYSAKKTDCEHGHLHDSGMEARRCNELHLLQSTGNIQRLEFQPEFPVEINGKKVCVYRADFAYFVSTCRIVEDVKGFKTDIYRLKKKLVEAVHTGTVITEWPVKPRKKRVSKRAL